MQNKIISKINFKIFFLGLVIFVQAISMIFFFRQYFEYQAENKLHINSLINEIGDLKEENQILFDSIESKDQTIKNLYGNFQAFQLKFSALEEEKNNINQEKQEINNQLLNSQTTSKSIEETKNQLEEELKKKQQQIENLKIETALQSRFSELGDELYSLLILGDNSNLTDAIILLTINKTNQKIAMISIPRDLAYQGRKINEVFKAYGPEKTKDIIKEVTGIKPQHYLHVNFNSVASAIDLIGGIDIEVDKELIDPYFPTNNFGFQKVVFNQGLNHLDGEKALQYARSRKTTSDFDRAKRQQQILIAIKEKVKSMGLKNNLSFFMTAYQNFNQDIKSDLNILDIFNLFEDVNSYNMSAGNVLNTQNYLYQTRNVKGQYILLPKTQNFLAIKEAILNII